jgi:hypothetical protein
MESSEWRRLRLEAKAEGSDSEVEPEEGMLVPASDHPYTLHRLDTSW